MENPKPTETGTLAGVPPLATGSAGWVPIATPPPVDVSVALHFGWGEVRDGWRMSTGLYRTASMPLPQDTATITHWCALPNASDDQRAQRE